jgi:hypothetical protein
MVATPTVWASGATPTTTGSTWTNTGNTAGANDGSFGTFTNSSAGAAGTILLTSYGAQDALGMMIPVSVDSVVTTCYWYVANTGRWTAASCTVQLYDGATPLGSATAIGTLTTTTTNSTVQTFTGVAAWANLAALGVLITATHSGTSSSTFNIDAVGVVVNYTPSAVVPANAPGGSAGGYVKVID